MRYAHLFFFFHLFGPRSPLFLCVFFLSSPRRERKAFSPAASRKRKPPPRVLKRGIGFAYLRHLLRLVCKEEKHKSGDNFKCQLRSYLCFRSRTKRSNKTVMSCFSNLSRSVDVRRTKKKRRDHKANKKSEVRSSAPLQSDSFMNEMRLHACSQVPQHHHGIFIFSSYLVLFLFETKYVHYSCSFFFFLYLSPLKTSTVSFAVGVYPPHVL